MLTSFFSFFINLSTRWEPMNPAPPVIKILILDCHQRREHLLDHITSFMTILKKFASDSSANKENIYWKLIVILFLKRKKKKKERKKKRRRRRRITRYKITIITWKNLEFLKGDGDGGGFVAPWLSPFEASLAITVRFFLKSWGPRQSKTLNLPSNSHKPTNATLI